MERLSVIPLYYTHLDSKKKNEQMKDGGLTSNDSFIHFLFLILIIIFFSFPFSRQNINSLELFLIFFLVASLPH